MKQIKGGVTAAKGYEAASTAAGIKYQGRTDMALIYSQVPCVSAGTFTTNVVKAAPVKWDRQIVDSGAGVQAVVVNSGIANAKRQPRQQRKRLILTQQVSWLVPQESSECSFRCRSWWTESRCWQERKQKVYRADTMQLLQS